ncbi:hypothetical protein D621_05660 [beta proteobacterium AAP51]|nr:hypothetical protein D621_05660 [beta proteobacterium AAP51]
MTPEQKERQRAGLKAWASKPETRAKLSASAKRRANTEEAREENSLRMSAHYAIPEHRQRQSATAKAVYESDALRRLVGHMTSWAKAFKKANGYPPTPEEKAAERARFLGGAT